MPRVGLKPTIPVFKRAKTVHALDSADTVIGTSVYGGGKKKPEVTVTICVVPLHDYCYRHFR
jgi:hypothetical protein